MATKQEMVEELKARGVQADASMAPATLAKMLRDTAEKPNVPPVPNENGEDGDDDSDKGGAVPPQGEREGYMKLSDVKALIAEALASAKEDARAPVKVKKITQYTAHVWRFDGKWVVDFRDKNINKETGEIIDPYIKHKLHAYNKFNDQTRQFEAWIELVFDDGTTKDVSLTSYVENRVLVYCPIINRFKIDKSYVIGEVERKKEEGDKYVGTGVLVDQEVTMYEEVFEIRTPDGKVFKIPEHAIA